jgi:hypothetical protein
MKQKDGVTAHVRLLEVPPDCYNPRGVMDDEDARRRGAEQG